MEKVIEFLNSQGCKCENLQLFSVKFSPSLNKLNVIFSSPVEYTEQDSQKIHQAVEKFVENRCEVQTKIKKQIVSADTCEFVIRKILTENAIYSTIFNLENVKVELSNTLNCSVSLRVDKSGFDGQEKQKFELICEGKLKPLGINSLEFTYSDFACDYGQILSSRKEAFDEELIDEPSIVKVSFVKKYLGKMDEPCDVLLPELVQSGKKNIFVCGMFSNLQEFTRKKEDTQKETKYYKFMLNSEEGKIECVCFLKNGEDLANLDEGQKVVVLADSEDFRGSVSLRVRGVSLCKFNFPPKKVKTVNKNYRLIKPEPYISKEQISFLEKTEQITNEYLLNNNFVVFDLETTGLNYNTCKIIEIGAVKIEKGKITQTFSTFVNPQCHIPEDATKKNNITDDMVKNAPTFEQVFPDFFKFIEGSTLVAHNINFDLPFISYYARLIGYTIENPTQDTYLIVQKHLGQLRNFRLATVCEFFGVSLIGAHRALNDTVATAKVFVKLIEKYGKD